MGSWTHHSRVQEGRCFHGYKVPGDYTICHLHEYEVPEDYAVKNSKKKYQVSSMAVRIYLNHRRITSCRCQLSQNNSCVYIDYRRLTIHTCVALIEEPRRIDTNYRAKSPKKYPSRTGIDKLSKQCRPASTGTARPRIDKLHPVVNEDSTMSPVCFPRPIYWSRFPRTFNSTSSSY